MVKIIMKNYTTEKMKNHKNKKQTKKERKIYFTQATFKEKQKASYEKLFSRNILFLKYIIFIIFIVYHIYNIYKSFIFIL